MGLLRDVVHKLTPSSFKERSLGNLEDCKFGDIGGFRICHLGCCCSHHSSRSCQRWLAMSCLTEELAQSNNLQTLRLPIQHRLGAQGVSM